MGRYTEYIEQRFPIRCKGRDENGNDVLEKAVNVVILVRKSPSSDTISTEVRCPYNTGGHGQRCKASHPRSDKVGDGVGCPYSLDIPYALENPNRS